jgi:uncharacterized protein
VSEELPSWISLTGDQRVVRILLYAQPGAKVPGIVGVHDGALKVRISSPPVDGAANESLIQWLAENLGIRIRDVRLIKGQTSRKKVFEVKGLQAFEVFRKLPV